MGGLNAGLATALSGLAAGQGAMETTSNNVANVNTPGYSRQRAVLVSSDPIVVDPLTLGSGVRLEKIESLRDVILESQIQHESQSQGELSALVTALSQLETSFSGTSSDVGAAISKFFDSVNQLSAKPADLSSREALLTAANNVARAFNQAAGNLSDQKTSLNQSVEQSVSQINELTTEIADLNGRISSLENAGKSAGSLVDRRTQLIDQLSSLVDVSVIPSDNTLTLTTSSGTALVIGSVSYALSTGPDALGSQHIFSQGADITSTIVSGQLGGILRARDQEIPSVLDRLDTLATGLANAVNSVQISGFDLNGNPTSTEPLFTTISAEGAAASLSVAIEDPALIAASADGTAGNNGNAESMYALRNTAIISGQSPTEYYSSIVFKVGDSAANALAEQSASQLVLQQLQDQRASVSGVSLDEEAANLMRYQQAYAASAQVISAINQMMQDVINMKGS